MKHSPAVLAFVAGTVDTITFLSLSGLFAAHVTGNFVLLAATLVGHPRGVWSKVISLPVFFVAVWLASVAAETLRVHKRDIRNALLGTELLFLIAAWAMAAAWAPFSNADSPLALLCGMTLVAAMGVQNALGPLVYPTEPATAVMTTNVTRLFVDVAAIVAGKSDPRQRESALHIAANVIAFMLGCAAAATSHVLIGLMSLAIPVVAVGALLAKGR